MNSPVLYSFPVCPFSSITRQRQRTVALLSVANVSPRVPSDWWKPRVARTRARARVKARGRAFVRVRCLSKGIVWLLSRGRVSPETVERFPKGKLPEPSRIIRLGEQSIEVERGRHVCVRTAMQFIRLHFTGRHEGPSTYPEMEEGGERDLSASRSRMHPLNLAIDSDRFNGNK